MGYIQRKDCPKKCVAKSPQINFQCHESRLFRSEAYPYLMASPDGLISCNCCGKDILGIKCTGSRQEKLIT